MKFIYILIAAFLSENFVLSKLLGIYPAIDVQNRKYPIVQEGILVTTAVTIMTVLSHIIYTLILEPLNITYLATIVFALVLFLAAQLTVLISKNMGNYNNREISVGQLVVNSVIFAAIFLSINQDLNLLSSIANSIGAGLGYTLVSILLADAIDRIDDEAVIGAFRGVPIQLISLGLMAYAFWGFSGLVP